MRPSERATAMQRTRVGARSSRRARRRTLFSPAAAGGASPPDDGDVFDESALAEFVIDDDDYPVVVGAPRAEVAPAEPDRVDDIDDWLEEFAVSDYFGIPPH